MVQITRASVKLLSRLWLHFAFGSFHLEGCSGYKLLRVPSFLSVWNRFLSLINVPLVLNATQLLNIYHEASTLIGARDTGLGTKAQWRETESPQFTQYGVCYNEGSRVHHGEKKREILKSV